MHFEFDTTCAYGLADCCLLDRTMSIKTDASGQIAACTVTWAGAPGVLPAGASYLGIGCVVTYFAKAALQPQPEP
ncbi:hypothetical protein ABIE53_001004 [Burkholderia sp. OAS925]